MEMQSNFQPRMARFTPATIFCAVMVGPEMNLTGCFWPVIRIFTCVPPTSRTRTLRSFAADGLATMCFLPGETRRYIARWEESNGELAGDKGEAVRLPKSTQESFVESVLIPQYNPPRFAGVLSGNKSKVADLVKPRSTRGAKFFDD